MYSLTNTSTYHFPPLSRSSDSGSETYVTAIRRLASDSFATISSDQQLSLFEAGNIVRGPAVSLKTNHGNVTGLEVFGGQQDTQGNQVVVVTSGEDGSVGVWDLRAGREVVRFKAAEAPILSLACNPSTQTIAVGTELANHAAHIHIWDVRNTTPSSPSATFSDLHSDDITTLSYHPSSPNLLLSGSTDGLVSIYDLSIPEEDDMTIQTFNHNASIHHAGFLTDNEVVALSHDEKMAIYEIDQEREGTDAAVDFGDVRGGMGCQYVADVTPKMDGSGAVVGAGSQDEERFGLTFLAKTTDNRGWVFDGESSVNLPGGHGGEIVRGFCFFDEDMAVFTAGEDGCVKAWRPGN